MKKGPRAGFVKLWRKIQDHYLYPDGRPFTDFEAFLDLAILQPNYKRKLWKGHVIERGEFFTSLKKLAKRWQWSRSRVVRYLKDRKLEKEVSIRVVGRCTIIRSINFEKYQGNKKDPGTISIPRLKLRSVRSRTQLKKKESRRNYYNNSRSEFLREVK